jgi:hypothetical protein
MSDSLLHHEPSGQMLRLSQQNATGYKHVTEVDDKFLARIQTAKGKDDILLGRHNTKIDAAVAVAKYLDKAEDAPIPVEKLHRAKPGEKKRRCASDQRKAVLARSFACSVHARSRVCSPRARRCA